MLVNLLVSWIFKALRDDIRTRKLLERMISQLRILRVVKTRRRSYSLPTDMKIELMSRLPAATILRFRLLSRSFQSLLKSPSFEEAFYQRHHSEIKVGVLQTTEERNTLAYCFCDGDLEEIIPGPSTAGTNLSYVGTYRGMVALVACTPPNGWQSIILWNPTTRVHVCVPLQEKPYSCYLYGLCYDDNLGWSVVLARRKGRRMNPSITIIYLEFSSGRKIKSEQHGVFPIYSIEDEGIVARGTPYWVNLAYNPRPVLMKYNGKEFEVIQLPQGLIDTTPSLHSKIYTGSLGLIHDDLCILTQRGTSDQFEIWTSQDCKNITSWSKTLTFFIEGLVVPKVGLQMIGKSGNKLVLTANEGRILVTFDLSTNNAHIKDFGADGRCFGYTASLESPPLR